MKFMLGASELWSIYHFGPKCQYKELGCHTHFLENCCFIWAELQLSHNFRPTSCWFWKLDQVVESYRQFSILGPNALNKEIRCHTHFWWNMLLFEYIYNPLIILPPIISCRWKLDQVFQSCSQFSILSPNAPNKVVRCHDHLFKNFQFIWVYVFTIFLRFCIQWALV